MRYEIKQESSVPIQSRISITSIAKLDSFWFKEGYSIRTMSQLIAWSMDLLCEVLENNKKIEGEVSVADAYRYLQQRGLFQNSMMKRSFQKAATAVRFEGMREEGLDPRTEAQLQYNRIHNKQSVQPISEEEIRKLLSERRLVEQEEMRKAREQAIEGARASGHLVSETEAAVLEKVNVVSREDREKEYLRKLNAPVQEQIKEMKEMGLVVPKNGSTGNE